MRNTHLRLGALACSALVVVSSCTMIPAYERPVAPVPTQFAGGGASGGAAAADRGWRDIFADARLQRLIELAIASNRDLRIAALNVELVRAQYRIARADLLPSVSASGGMTYGRTAGQTGETYRVGLGAAYEIDLFGRVRSLKEAALEQYLASAEAQRAAHLALIAEVATQYLRERAFDEQRVLAERTVTTVGESAALTQRLFAAGQRSDLDARTAEAQQAAAVAEVHRLARLQAQAHNALAMLIGQPLPADLPPAQPIDTQDLVVDLPAGVSSELLQRRPDILAAEHELKAANANIGAARAAFFPNISLTGFAGFASTALSKLFTGDAFTWSVEPSVSVPLFTGGRTQANLDVAHLRKRIEIARYERAIQNAFREVSDGLVARATFQDQLTAQAARAAAEQKRFEISETRYRNGIESYVTVLAAQQDLYATQTQLIELRFSRLASLAALYTALGGGWLERSAASERQASLMR